MQNKVSINMNMGMLRDTSISKADNKFAFENHNIRISARDKDTLLSVTNERGNVPIVITPDSAATGGIAASEIKGKTLIGHAVLNNYLVLFTTGIDADRIYRIEYEKTEDSEIWKGKLLYEGSLGFSAENPIETISLYETEDIQKVYWVDGKNQPRFINIKKDYYYITEDTEKVYYVEENGSVVEHTVIVKGGELKFLKDTIFDFVTDFNRDKRTNFKLSVEKQNLGLGSFPAGTIQYLCTYYNKFGQETNTVCISPVYYVSPERRGASPEETVTCSFKINIVNPDTEFDYVRVYALLRTYEFGTPIAYIVGDIKIEGKTLSVIDTGQGDNTAIDPTILLYVGGRELIAETFTHKDNTLFLGGLTLKSAESDEAIKDQFDALQKNEEIYDKDSYESKVISFFKSSRYTAPYYKKEGLYPYKSQLNYSSDTITGFKGGEKYRFAVQFISGTGQKSQVFFVGDKTNSLYPEVDETTNSIRRPLARLTLPQSIAKTAINAGYKEVVLLMATPTEADRAIVAQGIISPTVFNLNQRHNNAPFAMSSWYMRPRNTQMSSRHFMSVNNVSSVSYVEDRDTGEQRLVSANVTFSEIQNIAPGKTPYYTNDSFDSTLIRIAYSIVTEERQKGQRGFHYVTSVYAVSLFDDGSKRSWKLKGSKNSKDISIFLPTGELGSSDFSALEKYEEAKIFESSPHLGYDTGNILSGIRSALESYGIKDEALLPSSFEEVRSGYRKQAAVGPSGGTVQARYALQNTEQYFIDENIVTFNTPDIDLLLSSDTTGLKFRIIGIAEVSSNITDYTIQTTTGRVSSASIYKASFNHTTSKYIEGLLTYPLLYDASVNIDETGDYIKTEDKLDYLDVESTPYYFDIYPFHKEGSVISGSKIEWDYSKIEKKTEANLRYCYSTKYLWTGQNAWTPSGEETIAAVTGDSSTQFRQLTTSGNNYLYQGTYDYMTLAEGTYPIFAVGVDSDLEESTIRGGISEAVGYTDEPVRIQFKANSHAVIKFGVVQEANELLPILSNEIQTILPEEEIYFPWENDVTKVYQKKLQYSTTEPYYFIGEIYKDFTDNDDRYGGASEFALKNNTFITISDREQLPEVGTIDIIGTSGDTYFQRWDCIKTEPYSNESKNGIVDITSFLVETHTNIDGRYDKRRGMIENVTTSEENTNKINRAYSNLGNFFTDRILDEKYNLSTFPNEITWTKTKAYAEDIDTWTNVTVANTLDLDGDKGGITALRRFNNTVIAFQDKGIAEVLFNSRTQISTTSGVPIEIANSGKVDGKRYISEKIGCLNKWSIVETKSGLYFIDNINKTISSIGQGITELSSTKGFSAWIKSYNSTSKWNPEDFDNFVAYYDSQHGDIYFIRRSDEARSDDSCLVYNEYLSQFTSFFDYKDVPMMRNISDKFVSFKDGSLWLQNEGEYNNLFGEVYPYWITYRVCPDPYIDKTFNNIEYRADILEHKTEGDMLEYPDSLLTDKTFDRLDVWNEYQEGSVDLRVNSMKVSDIKKKFRIWRANIPRDSKDRRGLNRIRNPWLFIKLTKDTDLGDERMEFHDLMVRYYE